MVSQSHSWTKASLIDSNQGFIPDTASPGEAQGRPPANRPQGHLSAGSTGQHCDAKVAPLSLLPPFHLPLTAHVPPPSLGFGPPVAPQQPAALLGVSTAEEASDSRRRVGVS